MVNVRKNLIKSAEKYLPKLNGRTKAALETDAEHFAEPDGMTEDEGGLNGW